MINGEITEFGVGKADQSGIYFIKQGSGSFSDSKKFGRNVWYIKNSGLSLFAAGKDQSAKDPCSRKFCGLYSQTTSQPDRKDKNLCRLQRSDDQQSGEGGTGRFFSNKGSWPKKRGKLKHHLSMIDCGSKNSHRFIIFLSLITIQIPTLIIIYLLSF